MANSALPVGVPACLGDGHARLVSCTLADFCRVSLAGRNPEERARAASEKSKIMKFVGSRIYKGSWREVGLPPPLLCRPLLLYESQAVYLEAESSILRARNPGSRVSEAHSIQNRKVFKQGPGEDGGITPESTGNTMHSATLKLLGTLTERME
jgi:hypothetical protein